MANKAGKGFLLTPKFYKGANHATLLDLEKRKPEWKADAQLEGMIVNKQEQTTTKQLRRGKFMPTSSTQILAIPEKK